MFSVDFMVKGRNVGGRPLDFISSRLLISFTQTAESIFALFVHPLLIVAGVSEMGNDYSK